MTAESILERRNRLVELVRRNGRVSTQEASAQFGVSLETIRQDLLYLEQRHILKKVHGGAVAWERATVEPLRKRRTEHEAVKAALARRALSYVQPGDTVGLDMGSTVAALAQLLAGGPASLLVTNSLLALETLTESEGRVYCLGGEYSAHDMAFQGEQAVSALKKLRLDVCFLGTSGVQGRGGICSTGFHDIPVKQEFIRRSRRTVVLADSSKFATASLVEVAGWEQVDTLITDSGIDPEQARQLSEKLELVIAEV